MRLPDTEATCMAAFVVTLLTLSIVGHGLRCQCRLYDPTDGIDECIEGGTHLCDCIDDRNKALKADGRDWEVSSHSCGEDV